LEFQPVTFIRKNSTRLPNKSFLEINNKPLCYYAIKTMSDLSKQNHVNNPIIYSSEDYYSSCKDFADLKYTFIKRDVFLDGDVDFNMLMSSFLKDKNVSITADYIVFFCVTGPFMKKETIVNMLDKIKSKEYDSSFTGIAIKNFCWFESKPLNYDLGKNIPWTQNLTPVIKETSSLYIFKKDDFLSSGRRIGFKPYIKIVDPMEGHDIDYQYEFTLAKKILEGEI